jgi:hypothetical protein
MTISRVALAAAVVAFIGVPLRPAAQDADVFARRGVYVETDRGVAEMTRYAEAAPLHDAGDTRTYRYLIPDTLQAPRAKVVLSFVINMPGNRAEGWVAASQLLFVVGREIEEGRSDTYFVMTPKISRLRPSVYLVQSAEFQGGWLEQRYAQVLERRPGTRPPGFVALVVQDANGQPRKLYPVQVFGE